MNEEHLQLHKQMCETSEEIVEILSEKALEEGFDVEIVLGSMVNAFAMMSLDYIKAIEKSVDNRKEFILGLITDLK